jgi:hypothetical protein
MLKEVTTYLEVLMQLAQNSQAGGICIQGQYTMSTSMGQGVACNGVMIYVAGSAHQNRRRLQQKQIIKKANESATDRSNHEISILKQKLAIACSC